MPSKQSLEALSERALFERARRRVLHDGLFLHRCRWDSQWFRDLGRFYAVNERNHIAGTDLDLVEVLLG